MTEPYLPHDSNSQKSYEQSSLPPELWAKIFQNLRLRDLYSIRLVNKHFNELFLDPYVNPQYHEYRYKFYISTEADQLEDRRRVLFCDSMYCLICWRCTIKEELDYEDHDYDYPGLITADFDKCSSCGKTKDEILPYHYCANCKQFTDKFATCNTCFEPFCKKCAGYKLQNDMGNYCGKCDKGEEKGYWNKCDDKCTEHIVCHDCGYFKCDTKIQKTYCGQYVCNKCLYHGKYFRNYHLDDTFECDCTDNLIKCGGCNRHVDNYDRKCEKCGTLICGHCWGNFPCELIRHPCLNGYMGWIDVNYSPGENEKWIYGKDRIY